MKKLLLIIFFFALTFSSPAQNNEQQPDTLTTLNNKLNELLNKTARQDGEKSKEYATVLYYSGYAYCYQNNFTKALNYLLAANNILKKYPKDKIDYRTTLLQLLGTCYLHIGDDEKALAYLAESLPLIEQSKGRNKEYASSLIFIAAIYMKEGKYNDAIDLNHEIIEIIKRVDGQKNDSYLNCLVNIAQCYFNIGQFMEASSIFYDVLRTQENLHGKENSDYATYLVFYARCFTKLEKYHTAIDLESEALNIYERTENKESQSYLSCLLFLAHNYSSLGKFQKSIELESEALKIKEGLSGKENLTYAKILTDLSYFYSKLGQDLNAQNLESEAIKIIDALTEDNKLLDADILSSMARNFFLLENDEQAIELESKALRIREENNDINNLEYAEGLNNMAVYYFPLFQFQKSINLDLKALKIQEREHRTGNPLYISSLLNLALAYYLADDLNNAGHYFIKFCNHLSTILLNYLSNMTSLERFDYWNNFSAMYSYYLPLYAVEIQNDSLTAETYNAALLSKRLLLNSEMEMTKLLKESDNPEIINKYKTLREQKIILSKLYETPIDERSMDTDSIETLIENMENDLIKKVNTYGSYTNKLKMNWKDVQKELGPKDLAIEFLSFLSYDSSGYVALTLAKGDRFPKIVKLFDNQDLNKIAPVRYYSDSSLANLVWGKLADRMKGKSNIYFAASGILNNIAIENLPDFKNKGFLSDYWNFYRLSSTREIALVKSKKKVKTACLYGGLEYDLDKDVFIASERHSATLSYDGISNYLTISIADSLGMRVGTDYLPWTHTEIQNISRILKKKHFNTTVINGSEGTETSFKNLSGEKTGIIHVATHGFFYNETEAEKKAERSRLRFLGFEYDRNRSYEDKALTRSGLLFSGAKIALNGGKLPSDVDDGILTAKEISMMDLRGLDLVVLSACQTGLGDITDDGVFGLQRGLKKAGANSIMMSLWKVDDKATSLLMEQFYTNLTSGLSKEDSLKAAQKYLMEYEKGGRHPYADPKYWAAFILLDAIN